MKNTVIAVVSLLRLLLGSAFLITSLTCIKGATFNLYPFFFVSKKDLILS